MTREGQSIFMQKPSGNIREAFFWLGKDFFHPLGLDSV